MKSLSNTIKFTILLFLSASLVFLYPTSILTMDHDLMAMETSMLHGSMSGVSLYSPLPVNDAAQCVNFHMDLLQRLSQSLPQTPIMSVMIVAFILTFGLLADGLVRQSLDYLEAILLLRYQRLKLIPIKSFMSQLGDWLAIIEKKSPAYAFATA